MYCSTSVLQYTCTAVQGAKWNKKIGGRSFVIICGAFMDSTMYSMATDGFRRRRGDIASSTYPNGHLEGKPATRDFFDIFRSPSLNILGSLVLFEIFSRKPGNNQKKKI